MTERETRKIPVTDRECLWVLNEDMGEVSLFVGPTLVQPAAADRVVVDDGEGGFRIDASARPQKMIEISDGQYAVINNPVESAGPGNPNGDFKEGKNSSVDLRNGTKAMVSGPCAFYLRPGQRVEVRDAHRLDANEFVVAEVYGEVDEDSEYYDLTVDAARSSAFTRPAATDSEDDASEQKRALRRGARIVITGLDTNFYIPPTGIDIVPDTSVDSSGTRVTPEVARRLLRGIAADSTASVSNRLPEMSYADASEKGYDPEAIRQHLEALSTPVFKKGGAITRSAMSDDRMVDQSARSRHRVDPFYAQDKAAAQQAMMSVNLAAGDDYVSEERQAEAREHLEDMVQNVPSFQSAIQKEARKAALVRKAVVLGEKEFCVIVNEDGQRQVKRGPARVFPGPHDRFQTHGSRNRIYDAYELLPQRALWLRVITSITADDLRKNLPPGVKFEADSYEPGHELIIHGVSAFFFPFNEIEVLDATGEVVVGNDHSRVIIEEIGIDQKSGIYVRDLNTGEARLIRGKQSYLVDPRKEVQIIRIVPPEDWNLMIAEFEPHKRSNKPVTTPWAVSVTIPHNMAVLATSATGQRIAVGPCVELLDYEERLAVLKLSTGRPKQTNRALSTCFLKIRGNRVSDVIEVVTSDFVRLSMTVSYTIAFLEEQKSRWFDHQNYVQLLANHMRSMTRGAVRKLDFLEFWPQVEDFTRNVILGTKTEEEGERTGRTFTENGMHISEVEVLASTIDDAEISDRMREVQRESVTLCIGDREAHEQLKSAKLRAAIGDETRVIESAEREKNHEVGLKDAELSHASTLNVIGKGHDESKKRLANESEREMLRLRDQAEREELALQAKLEDLRKTAEAQREVDAAKALLDAETLDRQHDLERRYRQAMEEIETAAHLSRSEATVNELKAVQPQLVEALTALGEAGLAKVAAENMGLISLVKGQDATTLLSNLLGGTRAARVLNAMSEKYPSTAASLPPSNGDGTTPTTP